MVADTPAFQQVCTFTGRNVNCSSVSFIYSPGKRGKEFHIVSNAVVLVVEAWQGADRMLFPWGIPLWL